MEYCVTIRWSDEGDFPTMTTVGLEVTNYQGVQVYLACHPGCGDGAPGDALLAGCAAQDVAAWLHDFDRQLELF